jgi:hypothetical protein
MLWKAFIMQDHSSESTPAKEKKPIRSIWFWISIGLAFMVGLFFIMLPVGIEYGIERYLKDQGVDQPSLEDVDFNPFTGRLALKNLSVIRDGQPVLKLPLAIFDIEWAPLVRKRVVLKLIAIRSLELTVQAFEDGGMQIGGIKLPDKPEKEETSEPSTWNFGLLQVTVENSKVKFISPQLSSDLKIEEMAISKLRSWLPERNTDLEFKGQLNDGSLQFQMDVTPFAGKIAASGQIKLTGLTLTPFAPLLKPQINTLEGRFDADLNIETRQEADGGFSHRQKGLLKLSQIRTQIKDTEFSNENLAWDGAVEADIPKSGEALKINTDGKLNGSKLSMAAKNANMQIQQEQLNWKGKVNFEQTPGAVNLNVDSTLSLQNTGMNTPDVKLTEEKLNWKGTVQLSIAEKAGEQRIIADGNLASGPLTVNLAQQKLNLTHAGLDWQGKLDYAQEKSSMNINTDGQMRLAAVKMESPQINLAEEELTWQGALQFSIPADAGSQRVIADGAIDGNHLQADLPGRKLKLGHQGLSWKGRLDSGEKNDFSSLKAEADFSLNDIKILQSETSQHLFNLDQADFQAIQIEGLDEIKVSGIALNGLALLAELKSAQSTDADPSLLRMQALEVKDIRLSQQKDLAIEFINLKAMKIFVHRDPQGKLPAIERLNAVQSDVSSRDQSKPAASDTKTKAKPSDFGFRIGQIQITGDSKLGFKDESVSPAFSIDMGLLEARLADLDSRRPQRPATVKLLISDEEDGRLSLDGTMQPFGEQVNLDWTGKIESFALPPLSPYVIQNTGYRFVRGQMNADIPVKINQNQLDGKIDLIVYNPKVERVKSEAPPEERQGKIQIGMPLDSALNLMRDKQNNVRLKVPISGDINDPKFSVTDAINKVLAQALQKSAVSYLKYMLGPYGIGIAAAELLIDGTSKIRLNPIPFAPGGDELDEAASDYLERVAAIMKEHPEVQVVVCGVATERDRKALGASSSTATEVPLLELAKNRTKRIKNQLVKSHDIAAKRIIACEPKIDSGAEAKPRADLEI